MEQEVIYETEKPVEQVNIIEEIIEVPIERIIEKPVEVFKERIVEIPIDNIIE